MSVAIACGMSVASAETVREDCREVDYSKEVGAQRDQGQTGWCYAHTAADLLTQHLKTRISAVDLATSYILYDLSQVRGAPERVQKIERWRRDEPGNYAPGIILSENGLYNVGGNDQDAILLSDLKGFCAEADLPGGPLEFTAHMREVARLARDEKASAKCLEKSRAESSRIGSIDDPAAQDLARLFQCYVDQKCGRRIRPARPVVADAFETSPTVEDYYRDVEKRKIDPAVAHAKLFGKLDELLDAGKIVSVGWDSSDIYAVDEKYTDHAATIIARKKIGGVCHYRLRDHFGAECFEMKKSFKGRCDKKTGAIWFSRGQIPSLYSLVWIR